MAVEAMLGARGSFDPFVSQEARPHIGQVRFLDFFKPVA
jgi:phenylalanine ammonia-lyase